MPSRQVFFDPSGRRRRAVNGVGAIALAALSLAFTVVVAGLLTPPELPALHRDGANLPTLAAGSRKHFTWMASPGFSAEKRRYARSAPEAAKRFAFLETLDPNSLLSLEENAAKLDAVLASFLIVDKSTGELARTSVRIENSVRDLIGKTAPSLEIFPVFSAGDQQAAAAALIASPEKRARLAHRIAEYLESNGDAGVALALFNLPPASHEHLFNLTAEFKRVLAPAGRKVIVVAPAAEKLSHVQELARAADYMLITFYHEFQPGSPKPLASQGWFERRLAEELAVLDRNRLIVGLGSFGYDSGRSRGAIISVSKVWSLMRRAQASVTFDRRTLNPWLHYADPGRGDHEVWFLDGVTAFNQITAALERKPAGLALSRLGTEDPGVWASFAKGREPSAEARDELTRLRDDIFVDLNVHKPEVIAPPSSSKETARRTVSHNDSIGLIVDENIRLPASGHEVAVWSALDKMAVALTFDDGPHEEITEKILDILAQKSVRASFFVVGRHALLNPGPLRRIYNEGHDLGNHTFTHPNLLSLSPAEFKLELTATQRTLEVLTGVHTTLFRPPYVAGVLEPEGLSIFQRSSKLGYLTVTAGVDSFDWMTPPPNAQQIHDIIMRQVLGGRGQVVLFHDWGRKRATLQALPLVIDSLRGKGYRFVTLHELIGKTRGDVMPAAASSELLSNATATIRRSSVMAMNWLQRQLPRLAVLVSILGISRVVFVVVNVARHRKLERDRAGHDWRPPSAAAIVPAYNEEKVICKTIRSLKSSGWKSLEIIVVDDGSTDRTAHVVREAYAGDEGVRLFVKTNGGKAEAANFALSQTKAEVVICVDADTVLGPDAIPLLTRHFSAPEVGAVAGTVVVGNQVNLLTRFQALEYLVGQCLDRRAFAMANAIGIVPGAIGAWRRKALLEAGGYSRNTITEDADLTFAVTRAGWKVLYEPLAEARTEAPENLRAFLKQRRRWMFGMLQVVSKHAGILRQGPRGLALITIPNVVVFQFAFSFLMPVLGAMAVWDLLNFCVSWMRDSHPAFTASSVNYMAWWMLFVALDVAVMLVMFKFSGVRDGVRLAPFVLLQRFLYWPLIYWTAGATLLAAIKGRMAGWNKLLRTGSVRLEGAAPEGETA